MVTQQLAKNLRSVFYGGNWTAVNLKDTLSNVEWQQAVAKKGDAHSISELVFHINYFVVAVIGVLKNNVLNAHDRYSFDLPRIHGSSDWESLVHGCLNNAMVCASLIEQLKDEQLEATFVEEKYGTYYGNLSGVVEHTHYHLGQIVMIKKLEI